METLKSIRPYKPCANEVVVQKTVEDQAQTWASLLEDMNQCLLSGAWLYPYDAYVISQYNNVLHEENLMVLKSNGWFCYTPGTHDPFHKHIIMISCVPKDQTAYPYKEGYVAL